MIIAIRRVSEFYKRDEISIARVEATRKVEKNDLKRFHTLENQASAIVKISEKAKRMEKEAEDLKIHDENLKSKNAARTKDTLAQRQINAAKFNAAYAVSASGNATYPAPIPVAKVVT